MPTLHPPLAQPGPAKLIVADDHPLFRAALHGAIVKLLPGVQVFESEALDPLLRLVEEHPDADLVLLDLNMPGSQGFSTLLHLRGQHPAIPVAIVSAHEDPTIIRRAMDFGAAAYIPKSTSLDNIGVALRAVLDGLQWMPPGLPEDGSEQADDQAVAQRVASLTPQQFKVLMMLVAGRLNKQIAADLDVSEGTVKTHVTAILRKLGMYRRIQAAMLAQRLLRADAEPFIVGELAPLAGGDAQDE